MKRILVTGAGGSPATNFIRSLRKSPEKFHIVGVDADKYCLQRAETDECHLGPSCKDPGYLEIISDIVKETGAEFIHAQPDVEIEALSENREKLPCRTFLPSKESIRICQDKYLSYERWQKAGLRVPGTMMIGTEEDLRRCFRDFGPKIWIRDTSGAFGKGSLPTSDFDQAKAWLTFQKGWGHYCGAECLEPDSVTWQSIWKDGELLVAQSRRRLYWEFANRAPSGVTGITGTGVTMADPELDGLAQQAILAIDTRPHGIWSVDMTLDKKGFPNPTEINIGRFFTTHQFFSDAGLNMPYIYLKTAFQEPVELPEPRINPLPEGLAWIRGMDFLPVLTTMAKIEACERELEQRRQRHSAGRV